jgi:hypothetical protein
MNKLTNADELEIAAELCLGAAMTKPLICLLGIIQVTRLVVYSYQTCLES